MKTPNIINYLSKQAIQLEQLIEGDKAYLKNKEYAQKGDRAGTARWKKIWEDRLANHQKQLKEYRAAITKLSK